MYVREVQRAFREWRKNISFKAHCRELQMGLIYFRVELFEMSCILTVDLSLELA